MLFEVEKECKWSRRYAPVSEEFPIKSIYVSRPFANDNETLEIVIAEWEELENKIKVR